MGQANQKKPWRFGQDFTWQNTQLVRYKIRLV
jgi:hypothetical protein